VRIIHRADGYSVQFLIKAERHVQHVQTFNQTGIDVGLKAYYTDSEGETVDNPRFYRKAEKKLKRLHRRLSKKQKKSVNRKKARKQLARAYLKVQRQREDFARKSANALVTSSDLIAYEDLKIRNLVKNRHLAKSIHDAGWGLFIRWVNYYGAMHDVPVLAVVPHFTSQDCSECGTRVRKSLSMRTHICHGCGVVLDLDHNAARNILARALAGTVGHTGTHSPME
jgi:putative transposase